MGAELGMRSLDSLDRTPYPLRDCRPGSLGSVYVAAGLTGEAEPCGEMIDDRIELRLRPFGPGVVAVRLGFVDRRLQLAESILVLPSRRGVHDFTGAAFLD